MKARSALNQGSSMALSPFLFFRTFYILLPSLFYEVRKDATLICSLGSRNLGLCGWTKVFSDWKPLEILLGRGTVMEAGARKWVDKLCTIRNDLGESGRWSELPFSTWRLYYLESRLFSIDRQTGKLPGTIGFLFDILIKLHRLYQVIPHESAGSVVYLPAPKVWLPHSFQWIISHISQNGGQDSGLIKTNRKVETQCSLPVAKYPIQ